MGTLLLQLLAWSLAGLWALALVGRLLHHEDHSLRLEPQGLEPDPEPDELISVIVPARNEARNIEACLAAVLAQDHRTLEVLVVDDRSQDGTGELARGLGDPRVQVLTGDGPPLGWAGKPAACQLAADRARGRWLLFLDADVRLAPWAVRRAVAVARTRRLDLLSLWGTWTLGSFWEQVLVPAIGGFVRAAHPLDQVNRPEAHTAFANGQFLLFRAEAYRGQGGHEPVRDAVLEDVALGRLVKRRGGRLGMLLSPEAFAVRLYTSFGEVWHGFSKNLYAGMDHRPLLALLAAGVVGGMHLGPLVVLAVAAALPSPALAITGLAGLGAMILIRALDDRAAGRSAAYAVTHPLGNAVLVAILLNSALRHHLGLSVRWKGREVKP